MFVLTLFKILLVVILGLLLGYSILTVFGIIIPKNRSFRPESTGIDLYLSTNGMHTDFVLPSMNNLFDWTKIIDSQYFKLNLNASNYLGIGWGDRSVYLDIAEWSELTFKIGFKTLMLPTPSILHVTAYENIPNTEKIKVQKITISEHQYLQLCHFILNYFKLDIAQNAQLIEGAGYTANDNFYHAKGKYHALHTCNTWVNKGLKMIGVRTPLWTPLDKGIFYQLNKISLQNRV